MARFRITIRSLLIAILAAAVVCHALRYASETWAIILCSLAVAAILAATARLFLARGQARWFWAGFAVIGATYLILTMAPGPARRIEPDVPTTWLLDRLFPIVCRPVTRQVAIPRGMFDESYSAWVNAHPDAEVVQLDFDSDDDTAMLFWVNPVHGPFLQIGHAVFAMLVAWLGGMLCALMAARLQKDQPQPA